MASTSTALEISQTEAPQPEPAPAKQKSQVLTNAVQIKQNMTSGGNSAFHNFK